MNRDQIEAELHTAQKNAEHLDAKATQIADEAAEAWLMVTHWEQTLDQYWNDK